MFCRSQCPGLMAMNTCIALETQAQRYPDGYSYGTFSLGLRSGRHAHAPAFSLIRRKPKIKILRTRNNNVSRLEMARFKCGEIVSRNLRCSSNTADTAVRSATIFFGNSNMLDTARGMISNRMLYASPRWELRAQHVLWSAVRNSPSSCVCRSLDSLEFD